MLPTQRVTATAAVINMLLYVDVCNRFQLLSSSVTPVFPQPRHHNVRYGRPHQGAALPLIDDHAADHRPGSKGEIFRPAQGRSTRPRVDALRDQLRVKTTDGKEILQCGLSYRPFVPSVLHMFRDLSPGLSFTFEYLKLLHVKLPSPMLPSAVKTAARNNQCSHSHARRSGDESRRSSAQGQHNSRKELNHCRSQHLTSHHAPATIITHPLFHSTIAPIVIDRSGYKSSHQVLVPFRHESRPHLLAPAPVLHHFGRGPEPLFGWESVMPLGHSYGQPRYIRRVKPDYRRFCFSVGKADVPFAALPGGPLWGMDVTMAPQIIGGHRW